MLFLVSNRSNKMSPNTDTRTVLKVIKLSDISIHPVIEIVFFKEDFSNKSTGVAGGRAKPCVAQQDLGEQI